MSNHRVTLYNGMSLDTTLNNGFRKTDSDLIKIDLLNHLFTRKGERLMMPNFGTSIQDLLFEPMDQLLETRIGNEIQTVIDYDPRIELINMSVNADEDRNKLTIEILLRFIELKIVDTINLDLPIG